MISQQIVLLLFKNGALTKIQLYKLMKDKGYLSRYKIGQSLGYLARQRCVRVKKVDDSATSSAAPSTNYDNISGLDLLTLSSHIIYKIAIALSKDGDISNLLPKRQTLLESRDCGIDTPKALTPEQILKEYGGMICLKPIYKETKERKAKPVVSAPKFMPLAKKPEPVAKVKKVPPNMILQSVWGIKKPSHWRGDLC